MYHYVCMYIYIYIIFCVWLFEGFMLGLPDPFWGLGAQFGRIFLTISLSKILTQEHLVSGHILGKWTSKPQIFTHLVMARLKVFVGPNFSCQFRHKANQCKGKHAIMSWCTAWGLFVTYFHMWPSDCGKSKGYEHIVKLTMCQADIFDTPGQVTMSTSHGFH